jgi:leucyl-tRNA---protein transferase
MTQEIGSSSRQHKSPGYVKSKRYGEILLDFLEPGAPHRCPYLPEKEAREEGFRADSFPPDLYEDFMNHGFRRAGSVFYRPVCGDCDECRPLRVITGRFNPSKSQRRVLKRNADIDVKLGLPRFSKEKYRLYSSYLDMHHGSSQGDSPEELEHFLYTSPIFTVEVEYLLRGRLVAVGILDLGFGSLSSVYTFFDPDLSSRSPGTLSVLREIMLCREKSLPHYYLGYFVAQCRSMNYKARFRPCEILTPDGRWVKSGQA